MGTVRPGDSTFVELSNLENHAHCTRVSPATDIASVSYRVLSHDEVMPDAQQPLYMQDHYEFLQASTSELHGHRKVPENLTSTWKADKITAV